VSLQLNGLHLLLVFSGARYYGQVLTHSPVSLTLILVASTLAHSPVVYGLHFLKSLSSIHQNLELSAVPLQASLVAATEPSFLIP
jgi:hypothetical protein